MKKILVIDDEESVGYSFQRLFSDPGYKVLTAHSAAEGLIKFKKETFDLVILDVRLPDTSGLNVLRQIKELDSKAVVLIITAFGTTETAIEATRQGAYDYILKPFEIPKIKNVIEDALKCSHLMHTEVVLAPERNDQTTGDRMIGSSPVMQEVYKLIGRVAPSDVNVLLLGESGTGKELVARAIYQYSNRAQKPFLAVNCAAIPETLLESELFGYEKGAFTGAIRRRIGKFEQADGGFIFLDEIGDMSLATQAKVLRILQEGRFERLGGDQTHQVDVRIIAATNKDLEKGIKNSSFREDLYYRLKVITITLPPLRLRGQDVLELVSYFLDKYSVQLKKERLSFSREATKRLETYHWPGNIRELENVIKRAIVLAKGSIITEEIVAEEFGRSGEQEPLTQTPAAAPQTISESEIEKYKGSLYEKIMEEAEKNLILQVLQNTGGNQVQATKILGISRTMLRDRIEKYGIKVETTIRKDFE